MWQGATQRLSPRRTAAAGSVKPRDPQAPPPGGGATDPRPRRRTPERGSATAPTSRPRRVEGDAPPRDAGLIARMSRLTLPVTLAFVALSCTSAAPSPPLGSDAARREDVALTDAAMDNPDVCPDPFACYGELVFPDGSMNPVYLYLRDGSVSDVPCPPGPPQCPIA